ncbi:MAG: E3 binding domain-containing protein, partial [Anaerolineales bacterium]|nr:E3 binding domain-containing protein [Anaerolineales bacterium]
MSNENRYEVVMPKLGLIMTEARLMEWHKPDGAWVVKGEPLFSLESDKSEIEIEASVNGRLQILIPAGETVPVMTPVAHLLAEKVAQGAAQSTAQNEVRATPKARAAARQQGIDLAALSGSGPRGMIVAADLPDADMPKAAPQPTIQATPVARKMAAELGLDLAKVTGTGENGRITRDDVTRTAAARLAQPQAVPPAPALPLTGLRGVIAERLSAGWRERPQVTLTAEV